jgi:hypothetical protein
MTVGVAVLVGAGLLSYGFPPSPVSVRAAPRTRATCDPERWWLCLPPSPPPPVVSVSPTCDVDCPASPSPSPIILVISPVPLGPPSPPTTPSYLIGRPSPAPSAPADTGGSPVPLGGGFGDLPTPSAGAVSSISDSGNRGDGLPLPLILLGFLFVAGVAGTLIYAMAPRGERFPERTGNTPGGAPITPGPDSTELKFRRPRSSGQ